ncbi:MULTISPECIES: hypothetical protein [unclassified Anabaena]|uniref:hypothetical protein n=1 Tax=unclassified Anabaena TaxID=2619674 RepID=UPI00082C94E3|nr:MULTISPECIES: hypothetical protein [unclassified Anabaena]
MTHQINSSDAYYAVASQVELELLSALLEAEDATYPWNPADNQSEAYFEELERQFALQDVLDEEITSRSPAFYHQLDTLWSQVSYSSYYNCNTNASLVDRLQKNLTNVVAAGVPQNWLNAIATKATQMLASPQSMGEQLVECVQAVLPSWTAEDLLILARPYAYAMRSSEPQSLTSVISNLENQDWTALSEIEQAKLSMAIAYHALQEINELETQA